MKLLALFIGSLGGTILILLMASAVASGNLGKSILAYLAIGLFTCFWVGRK